MDNSDEMLQAMTPQVRTCVKRMLSLTPQERLTTVFSQEKEVFNFDASRLDWEDYLMRYAYGLRTYALNEKG